MTHPRRDTGVYPASDIPEDIQAYLHIVKQVTVAETDHGWMVTMKREIGGQWFDATLTTSFIPRSLEEFEALVGTLRGTIARQIEKVL